MAEKIEVDLVSKLLIVKQGITALDVRQDIYSDLKEDWISSLNGETKLDFPIRTIGGDPLPGEKSAGAYFFIKNNLGWRIRPQESDHELIIVGNLYPEDSAYPIFVPTLGNYTVSIQIERSSLTQAISGTNSSMWSDAEKNQILSDISFIKEIEGGKWEINNDQMIFYKADNKTEIARFNITEDENGNPIMRTRL